MSQARATGSWGAWLGFTPAIPARSRRMPVPSKGWSAKRPSAWFRQLGVEAGWHLGVGRRVVEADGLEAGALGMEVGDGERVADDADVEPTSGQHPVEGERDRAAAKKGRGGRAWRGGGAVVR